MDERKTTTRNLEQFIGTSQEWIDRKSRSKEEEFIGTSAEFDGQTGRPPEEEFIGTSMAGADRSPAGKSSSEY